MTDSNAIPIDVLLQESAWVRRLAESLVHDKTIADDIVQQTWLAAMRRPPSDGRPVRPWLRTVVENFAKMRGRGEAARATRERAAARHEVDASSEDLVERVETQRLLGAMVLELDEPFRSTVILRYYEGLSSADIARRAGAPEGTVRWRLKRGLEMMRERLDRRHGGNREAWCALLTPLLPRTEVVATTTALGMPALLVLFLVLCGAVVAALWTRSPGENNFEAALKPDAEIEIPLETPTIERAAASDAVTPAPSNDVAARTDSATILARCVDANTRLPISASLSYDSATAASDVDGWVSLELQSSTSRWVELSASSEGRVTQIIGVAIEPGRRIELGDVEFERAGSVRGIVLAPDGRSLAGALVRAEEIGSRWQNVAVPPLEEARHLDSLLPADAPRATCDARGGFELHGLRESFVRLWIGAPGFETIWTEAIAVLGGEVADAGVLQLVELNPKNCIEGSVLDPEGQPVVGARVEAARRSIRAAFFRGAPSVVSARTDAQGRFRLCVDPQSTFEVAGVDAELVWRPMVIDHVAPGTRELELRLSPWRPFKVRATTVDGITPRDVSLEFTDARDGKRIELTDAADLSSSEIAPYRDFFVTVRARGCAAARLGPFGRDDAPEQVLATLEPFGGLFGIVRADGRELEDASVELIAASTRRGVAHSRFDGFEPFAMHIERPWHAITTRTDREGAFELSLDESRAWYLRVAAEGYAPAWFGPLQLDGSARLERNVDLSRGGELTGHVVRTDGELVAGTVVGISHGDGYLRTHRVGSDGTYRFTHLTPGRWQVRQVQRESFGETRLEFATSGTITQTFDVAVADGTTSSFDLLVTGTQRCHLRGRLTFDGQSVGPWTVELSAPNTPKLRTQVGPRGSFELDLPRTGPWTLEARSSNRSGVAYEFHDSLLVPAGTSDFTRDWSTGELQFEPAKDLTLTRNDSQAKLTITVERLHDATSFVLRVPNGKVEVDYSGVAPLEVDVIAGERKVVKLP